MTLDAKAVALPLIEALREPLEQINNATQGRYIFQAFLRDSGWDALLSDAEMASVREFFGVDVTLAALDEIASALESGDPDEVELIGKSLAAVIEIVERVNAWSGENHSGLPAPLDGSTNFWSVFPGELIDRLTAEAVSELLGPTFDILRLFGGADVRQANPGGAARVPYQRISLDWGALGTLATDPLGALQRTIGWDQPGQDFDHLRLFDILDDLFATGFLPRRQTPAAAKLDLYYSAGNPARSRVSELVVPLVFQPGAEFGTFAELGFKIMAIPPAGNPGGAPVGIVLSPVARGAIENQPGAGPWSLELTAGAIADDVFRLELRPSGANMAISGAASSIDLGVGLRGRFDPPAILIGAEKSHRLELEGVFLSAEVKGRADAPEIVVKAGTGEGPNPPRLRFVFQAGEGDGFLTKVVGTEPQTIDVGGYLSFSSVSGIGISGTAGLQIRMPLHLALGPIEIQALNVGTKATDNGGVAIPLGLDVAAALGPLQAVVADVGAEIRLVPATAGLLGNLDLDWRFKPPSGVGLSIDAAAVKGGGFLFIDPERGEYAGALELSILDFLVVKAIGVITTKMPGGSQGFAFIAIISVQFNPGLQLGFGFTLIGVGGLIGLNRSMELEALARGARSGSTDMILFPKDVVANAPRIISDLRTFFPPEEGAFLIGPMAKLGWGTPTLISLSLGIVIEIPGSVAIVGKLSVAIPDQRAALIVIQVVFIGAIEFDKKRGWFFATLFESRVIFMTLDGGLGVLAAFGNDPNFVVSVGGFHPAYNPPALPFPPIPRLAINILNTPVARIRVDAYFAVTSNTVQFGARAELYFGIGIASVEGHLGFDALFQFSPFYFIIAISAALSVKLFGMGLLGIRFRGSLEGPSPWHVEGTGSVSILWWDVDVDFSHTWGDKEDTRLPPISVLPILVAELEKEENWTAEPANANRLLVSLHTVDSGADLVLHPVGSLRITQRAIPLGLTLDKVGNQRPDDANRFTLDAATVGIEKRGTVRESFAMGQFQDMKSSEKLSAADYEKEDAGLELSITGNQTNTSFITKRIARYEQIVIDNHFQRAVLRFVTLIAGLFTHFLGSNAVARSEISARSLDRKHLLDEKIEVHPNSYVVVSLADNAPIDGVPAAFASRASAREFMARETARNPDFPGQAHIVRPHEMKEAA